MTRLDCNVEKCAYNADNCCKLREIDVKGTKACLLYTSSSSFFYEIGIEIVLMLYHYND